MRARLLAAAFCVFPILALWPGRDALAQDYQPPVLTCSELAECLTLLQRPYPCAPGCLTGAHQYAFIDDQGYFSLPGEFEKFGRPAVSPLLELLNHPDWTIRARAGIVIANLSAVDDTDLPAIIRESRNGNEWIAPALARIGTPEAIIQLINVVRKSPFLDKPHGLALKLLGKKAMPFVLQALTCDTDRDCSFFFVQAMGEFGAGWRIQSREIQARLIELAASGKYSRYIRGGALAGLRGWQPYDDSARLKIHPLLQSAEEEIRMAAVETLASWDDTVALPLLLEAIEKGDRQYGLLALLEDMGPAAISAGSLLAAKLDDDDWRFRTEIARVLGKIGYAPAASELISSITAGDWKLTYAAMVSLKQLGTVEGQTAIREAARNYWQPGIRLAAQAIADGKSEPTSPIEAYCANKDMDQAKLAAHPDLSDAVQAGNMLAFDDGRLVAVDAGEWGGALEFWPNTGLPFDLIKDESVRALLRSERGIFAVTGTPHMGSDDGFLYQVERTENGEWSARKIWRLPGAPRGVGYSPAGAIGIATNYGDVIFRPDSGMEWISCPARE